MTKDGYPAAYLRRAKSESLRLSVVVAGAGVVALFFGYRAIYRGGELQPAGITGGVFLFLLWVLYSSAKSPLKLALYFEKAVPGTFTWSAALARNCNYLDEIAKDNGAAPLSSFGFADDVRREPLVWHNADDGLETLRAVAMSLRQKPELLDESESVIADLEKWEVRLNEASKGETRFCLIFHGDGTNGMEVEQRKGFF